MPNTFLSHMLGDITEVESKVFNVALETGADLVKNVGKEFHINTNKNVFSHNKKSYRSIHHSHKSAQRRLM